MGPHGEVQRAGVSAAGAARDGRAPTAPAPAYTIGSDATERDRLRSQTDELHEHAVALLDRVGVQPGWRALDLACGPRGVLELLADRVGLDGTVAGLDINPVHVAQARELARLHALHTVHVAEADARRTGFAPASFELVHARLLLVNIRDPQAVVAEMVRLVRPGGWVACEEADGGAMLCDPADRAYDRLMEAFRTLYERSGADVFIGRRVPRLLGDAGLTEIGVEARADVPPPGHPRRTVILDLLRAMRAKVIDAGLLSAQELDQLDHAAREHLADPRTLVMPHLSFMAWGRRPTLAC